MYLEPRHLRTPAYAAYFGTHAAVFQLKSVGDAASTAFAIAIETRT